ncbi:MAG: zf-HC2 domain-containing protein [Candidatus Eisenbacteria bacterium]|nr:zf-HC2 domain-containing protein [Candidatus Eisenbacteria bacterium]
MTHRTEDELLAYALEVVESEEERAAIATHLETCPECRGRLESIRADIEAIAGVRPSRLAAGILDRRPRVQVVRAGLGGVRGFPLRAWLRAAALIVIGLVVGFGVGSRVEREPVFISPAYMEASPPAVAASGAAVSDATAVTPGYYESILE